MFRGGENRHESRGVQTFGVGDRKETDVGGGVQLE